MDDELLGRLVSSSNVKEVSENNDTLGKDLQEITKHLTEDNNTFKFGNPSKLMVFEDSLLGAIGDIPNYDTKKE